MVSGTRSLREQLVESIQDKEYRDALVEETISQSIAFQIRANRARRDWTQAELGRRAAKPQSEVSRLEDPDYEGYTLKTLMRLASAFDVGLAVRFVPFSAIVDDMANEKTRTFEVPAFSEDPGLKPKRDSGFQMSMAIFPFTAATNAIPRPRQL